MSAKDKKGLGYGTQLDEMSNKSETDSEISMCVFNVRLSDEEITPANDRFSKADGYDVVPPLITGNFLTPRADISFAGLDEHVIMKKIIESKTTEPIDDTSESKTSETVDDEDDVFEVNTVSPVKTNETQTVKTQVDKIGQISQKEGIGFKKIKACFVCKSTDHLIKDCDFYAKKCPEPKLKTMVNTSQKVVKPVWDNAKRGNPEICLQDHAVVDSGCSSHMTGNKAYLSDYEDYNGGFVAFGSDPKRGKITGKGKIRTANLDFDDVYFVDELKFNLFSVSQMCDKKNSVLFTDTECLILSPSFKLLDESQVVLRAPRQNGVYSLDLKNIVPFGDEIYKTSLVKKKEEGSSGLLSINKLNIGRPSVSASNLPLISTANTPYASAASTLTGSNTSGSSFVYLGGQKPIDASTLPNADLPIDPNMPDLEDDSNAFPNDGIFSGAYDDEDVGVEAASTIWNNTIDVQSLFPTLRVHKDHPKACFFCFASPRRNPDDITPLEDISWVEANARGNAPVQITEDYDEVFAPVAKIEAIRLFLAFASFMAFHVYQMDVKSGFLYGTIGEEVKQQPDGIFISQDKYVADILNKFDFCSIKIDTTPIELNKPLVKDEDGIDVDVHVYRSMIGSLMYLTASRPNIIFVVCACAMFQVTPKASHLNAVKRIFRKSTTGGCQFLGRRLISWQCKKSDNVANSTTDADTCLQLLNCCKASTKETSMNLRMDGSCAGSLFHIWSMANLRYSDKHNMVAFLKKPTESVGFTEIVDFLKGTSLRYALTHNPTIYDSLVKQFWQTATVRTLANGIQELVASIDNKEYIITEASIRSQLQLADATCITNLPDAKIYEGLATLGGFAGEHIPLLPAMLAGATPDQGEGLTIPAADEVTTTSVGVETEGATTITSGLDAGMDNGNIHESPLRSHESPLPKGNTSGSAEDSLNLKELMDIVPKLVLRIDNLEKELQQTKSTYGKAVLTLVERVKLPKAALKRKSMKVILSESKDEETEDQGMKIQDIDDDPLVSLVRNSMEEKETYFVTPKKVSASGEAQEEDISPTTLEAAKTLSKVASQNVSTYKRRARSASKGKDIGIGMDFFSASKERLNFAKVEVNTKVNPSSAGVNTELTKSLQGENVSSDDFAKRLVEQIIKKRSYAEQKAKAKRDKPMTQA
ncbi:uncharacterized mitochondrial protein-like protein [Tanacetum coccineum]